MLLIYIFAIGFGCLVVGGLLSVAAKTLDKPKIDEQPDWKKRHIARTEKEDRIRRDREARETTEGKAFQEDRWRDVTIDNRRPTGWVILPRAPEGKLVTISTDQDQKDTRELLIAAARQKKPYILTAEREPENPHDENAVAIYLGSHGSDERSKAGYIDKDIASILAGRFDPEMPISAYLHAMRTNGEQYYLNVRLLVPPKKERAEYEF